MPNAKLGWYKELLFQTNYKGNGRNQYAILLKYYHVSLLFLEKKQVQCFKINPSCQCYAMKRFTHNSVVFIQVAVNKMQIVFSNVELTQLQEGST